MVIVADKAAGRVADPVLRPVGALGDFFAMTLDTSVCMFKPPFAWREYLLQCWFVARVSTLPGVLMTIPWAVISGFLFNVLLTDIGAADFSGTGCAIFTVNQSAPIVTVLVVAGAGATAMCADLGARTIREELDALRVMGINPIQALAAPRVLAATTVSLALNSVVTATGLIGAFFCSVFLMHVSAGAWVTGLTTLTHTVDVVISMIKATLFGLMAGLIACYKGMSVGGGPAGVGRAVIRYDNLFGDRYLALEEGAGGLAVLRPGHTIPLARTQPALDLDALIGGFKPLFRALNPEQVNALSEQLLHAFAGQGPTIGSLLAQSAAVTNTLADRDRLIGQVITNLNVVLGSLGAHTDRLDQAVTSLSALIHRLAQRKTDISNAVAYTNAAAGSVADLLSQARAPLAKVVRETDRVAGIAAADHDYLDNLLNTLPDKYQALVRQGMYGDFFAFYLCDVVLKVNGKGGQPVYIKLAGQDSGRCAPK